MISFLHSASNTYTVNMSMRKKIIRKTGINGVFCPLCDDRNWIKGQCMCECGCMHVYLCVCVWICGTPTTPTPSQNTHQRHQSEWDSIKIYFPNLRSFKACISQMYIWLWQWQKYTSEFMLCFKWSQTCAHTNTQLHLYNHRQKDAVFTVERKGNFIYIYIIVDKISDTTRQDSYTDKSSTKVYAQNTRIQNKTFTFILGSRVVNNRISPSCQLHRVTSGQSNSIISKYTFQNSCHMLSTFIQCYSQLSSQIYKSILTQVWVWKFKIFIHSYNTKHTCIHKHQTEFFEESVSLILLLLSI